MKWKVGRRVDEEKIGARERLNDVVGRTVTEALDNNALALQPSGEPELVHDIFVAAEVLNAEIDTETYIVFAQAQKKRGMGQKRGSRKRGCQVGT